MAPKARKKLSMRSDPIQRRGLVDLCEHIKWILGPQISIVEIGAFVGESSVIFASYFSKVYSVDMWKSNYDPTDHDIASNPKKYDMSVVENKFDTMTWMFSNVNKYKMSSYDAALLFDDDSVHVVYIDGLHIYPGVQNDIRLWQPKVKYGGFLCGHDYTNKYHSGVRKAVNELVGNVTVFEDGSWYQRKVGYATV